jgi:hypothetical protein
MTDLPAPLVPDDCDMSGNTWFPLHLDRLDKSRWWKRASHLARSVNIDLWKAAYREVPAGSIEDDDFILADIARFGMDVDAFRAVKAEIMEPWTLCSNNRWYHPTLCEVVLKTWELGSPAKKTEAQRKADYRARVRAGVAGHGTKTAIKLGVSDEKPDNVPDGVGHSDKSSNERRGDGEGDSEGFALVVVETTDQIRQAFNEWNILAARIGHPIARDLTQMRRKHLGARLGAHGIEVWREALLTVEFSRFLRGWEGSRAWKADLDFLLQASSFQKVIEGRWPRNLTEEEAAHGPRTGTAAGGRGDQRQDALRSFDADARQGFRRE